MSGRDSSPKISLALLKGRTAGQSVPSISFRFNPQAENVTQVSDPEDVSASASERKPQKNDSLFKTRSPLRSRAPLNTGHVRPGSISIPRRIPQHKKRFGSPEDDEFFNTTTPRGTPPDSSSSSSSGINRAASLRDNSPVKEFSERVFGKRSSSLDSSPGGPTTAASETPPKVVESGSILSRITKTFEDKLNEIRNEKQKEKESKGLKDSEDKELLSLVGDGAETGSTSNEKTSDKKSKEKKGSDNGPSSSGEDKDSSKGEVESPRKKSSIVQDITEHTSKFKIELGNIGPKLSELRNQRSSKETTKNRSFNLNSLLGRDEGVCEEQLLESDEAELAVEAHEYILDTPLDNSEPQQTNESTVDGETEEEPKTTLSPEPSPKKLKEPKISGTVAQHVDTVSEFIRHMSDFLPVSMTNAHKVLAVVFIICFVLPIPRFLAGVLCGGFVCSVLSYALLRVLVPAVTDIPQVDEGPVLLDLPSYEDKQMFKGWMNELDGDYSPETYHVSLTHSVYVRLQGSRLYINHPRGNRPLVGDYFGLSPEGKVPKHARVNEEIRTSVFVHYREYDISGCDVLLLPTNLPRRWLWSRKYPICIKLRQPASRSLSPVSLSSTPTGSFKDSPAHSANMDIPVLGREGSWESNDGMRSTDHSKSSGDDDIMNSSLDIASFEEITQDMCQEKMLYLFARTDREKDDWFRRLVAASHPPADVTTPIVVNQQTDMSSAPVIMNTNTTEKIASGGGTGSSVGSGRISAATGSSGGAGGVGAGGGGGGSGNASEAQKDTTSQEPLSSSPTPELNFEHYMARILYHQADMDKNVAWVNALIGRIFFDFLCTPYWSNKVQERIQRKLSKIKVPYFVGELVVSDVQLGSTLPRLLSIGEPSVDQRGLWVNLDVDYTGNFTMSLETKLDLMKLKKSTTLGSSPSCSAPTTPGDVSPYSSSHSSSHTNSYMHSPSADRLMRNVPFDTDTDDSLESTSEEEEEEEGVSGSNEVSAGSTSRKILKIVDQVAASRYFQQATEYRLLQRALQGVSNTRIELSVEVKRVAGTLSVNVPPQPADRIWYGFQEDPELVMFARPRLGERQVNLPFLLEFIQKQLRLLFQKVFVLPNMDDLVIPIMSPLLPGQKEAKLAPWDVREQQSSASSTATTATLSTTTVSTATTTSTTNSSTPFASQLSSTPPTSATIQASTLTATYSAPQ